MQINLSWVLIAIFVSLSLFYYFNQKNRIRREEHRDRLKEKQQELLNSLMQKRDQQGTEDPKS